MDKSPPTLRGSVHVIVVTEMTATLRFFQNMLGFELVEGGADAAPEAASSKWLRRDKVWFLAIERPDATPISQAETHAWVAYVWVSDIDAVLADFEARGGTPWTPLEDKPWGMREFAVRTPDGHRVVFAQPTPRA